MKVSSIDPGDPEEQPFRLGLRTTPPLTAEVFLQMMQMGYFEQELRLEGDVLVWRDKEPLTKEGIALIDQRLTEAESFIQEADRNRTLEHKGFLRRHSTALGLPIYEPAFEVELPASGRDHYA